MSTDERKDLPPANSPRFLERVRESLSTYLGNRGDLLDRGITLRDLTDAGIVSLRPGFLTHGRGTPIGGVGSGVEGAYEIDLTPPPTPTGFAVSAAISNLLIECAAQTYTQGHGHAKSVLYGKTWTSGPLPIFSDAAVLTEFQGTVAAHATNPATTWHLWLKWVTVDGVYSITPAGGTNGLVTRTGEDVALLLEALSGEITRSQLHADLGTPIDRIGDGPVLPYSLVQMAADQDALNQAVRLDLNQASADLLDSITAISTTMQKVSDAGIYTDPGDGLVKIYGVEATNTSLNAVDVRLSAAEGSIVLKASTAYVDGAIAAAVLGEADLLLFSGMDARLSTAEVDINALESAVTLKATNLDLSATNVRMTTAEADINALEGQIVLKVDNADFTAVTGGLDSRLGSAEVTLSSIGDTSAITSMVQQGNTQWRTDAADAQTLLQSVLNGEAAATRDKESLAIAREQLTAYADAGVSAEAAQRLLLAAAVNTNLASLESEKVARANADSAEAAAREALAVLVASNGASITAEQAARANADTAEAAARTTLAARVTTTEGNISSNTAAISSEASARASADTAIANSVTTLSSTVAGNTAAISTEATTRASQTGDLYAQYTVKLDVNGKVSGYGLASTGPTGAGSTFEVRADKFVIAAETGGAAGFVPFQVLTVPTVIGGLTVPAGVYASKAFILDAQITNAKLGNASVDDLKVANVSAAKLTAGSIAVGQYIQATGYVSGSAGWRINGDGTAEFSGVVVRGTVYASAGSIGGNTIDATGMQSPGYVAGTTGWRLGSDGSLNAVSGSFKGSITGATGTFSGALGAATGTFAGALSAATGTFAGALSAATGTFSGLVSGGSLNINSKAIIDSAGNATFDGALLTGRNLVHASGDYALTGGVTNADGQYMINTGIPVDSWTGGQIPFIALAGTYGSWVSLDNNFTQDRWGVTCELLPWTVWTGTSYLWILAKVRTQGMTPNTSAGIRWKLYKAS